MIEVDISGLPPTTMIKALGKLPSGPEKERIQHSPQYQQGQFRNLIQTSLAFSPSKIWDVTKRRMNTQAGAPAQPIRPIKPDFKQFEQQDFGMIWLGHSSYLLRFGGQTWLIDPVLSGQASPIKGLVKAFEGMNFVNVADLPKIDILLFTHDHYDHLDYPTVKQLIPKVNRIVCPIGVESHLHYWGATTQQVTSLDWWESVMLDGVKLTATPARHFSGRTLKRNQSLWASYVLQLPVSGAQIFLGGDSGFGPHFKRIADHFGAFDFAIMECGQYDVNWADIHAMPEESAYAAFLLKAKAVIPVHWAKFKLALHGWTEPVERFLAEAEGLGLKVATPWPGQAFTWKSAALPNEEWWKHF